MFKLVMLAAAFIFSCGNGPGHFVSMHWNAPLPVLNHPEICNNNPSKPCLYRMYRAQGLVPNFTLLNPSNFQGTTFTDTSVVGGVTYRYRVTSVDPASGVESILSSNLFTVTVP